MGLAFVKGITFRIGICSVPRYWSHLVPLVAEGRITREMALSLAEEQKLITAGA
jgi:hypothetical protein